MATLNEVQGDALGALAEWMTGYTERQPQERVTLVEDVENDSIVVRYDCYETDESEMFRVTVLIDRVRSAIESED